MNTARKCKHWLLMLPALYWTSGAFADYKNDIGYDDLQTLLGSSAPTGSNVKITQVESSLVEDTDSAFPIYAPDTTISQFAGKTFSFPGSASTSSSGHATGVGQFFYGSNAMAPDINQITSYEANAWINSIATTTLSAPVNGSRIANHSWVGATDVQSDAGQVLRLVDRQVQRNEYIQVVGMANSPSNNPLLGSAYNVIAVGRTDGGHDYGSDAVDSVYTSGRTRPDLVAPQGVTSTATPIVSAAAVLLMETGHNGASALSDGSTTITGVGTVYNAERSETVKAALMAGADRVTANTSTTANISDYRSSGHQTVNGLDDRFGAGQVNILHSYQMIAAGEQDSLEDGGANAGAIGVYGFDYDEAFGGGSSNGTGTYQFIANGNTSLTASLVWNMGVSNDDGLNTTLHNLNLELFDATSQATAALSASTIDNTENIWINLIAGHSYQLLVKSGENTSFSWDYALAWRMSPNTAPVPIPTTLYLFVSALVSLVGISRRKTL